MSKKIGWALLGLAVLGLGVYWIRSRGDSRKPEYQFETAKLKKGSVVAKITATGTLSALVTVQVGSQVSGRIQELFVDFNSPVTKGKVLAKIDPQLFQAALEQARANHVAAQGSLVKAKAEANQAERQLGRTRQLAERKLVAPADLETAEAAAEGARAQVAAANGNAEQTRAVLHQAQVNLNYTTILSPIDGIIISRNVDVGQTVAASLQAPVLFVIAQDLREMQVDTSVAEADVGRLHSNMDATFRVDAYPSEIFRGRVRQIRNSPQTVQNVVTYDAVIDVRNADLRLRPGMTANVTFVYAKKDDVLRIPNAALRFQAPPALAEKFRSSPAMKKHESSDERTVWFLQGINAVPKILNTGISDGTFTEIVSGPARANDVVILDFTGGPPASSAPGMGGGGGGGRNNPFRRVF